MYTTEEGNQIKLDNNILSDKKIRTKNAILEAAQEAFLAGGYHNTDMRDIAKIVGIDRRTIYRYFSSKEALAFAIWQKVIAYIIDFGADSKGETGYEKLKNMLYSYMDEVRKNQNIVKFLGEFDHVFSGEYPHVEEADEFVNYILNSENGIQKCLTEGILDKSIRSDLDVKLAASTISNILLAMSQRVVIRGEHLKTEQGYSYEMLDDSVRIILNGIKNIDV